MVELITTKQLCEILSVTRQAVYKWRKSGLPVEIDNSGRGGRPKWYVKKRTKSGIYITIAEGNTRKDIIDRLKADSETYQKREE